MMPAQSKGKRKWREDDLYSDDELPVSATPENSIHELPNMVLSNESLSILQSRRSTSCNRQHKRRNTEPPQKAKTPAHLENPEIQKMISGEVQTQQSRVNVSLASLQRSFSTSMASPLSWGTIGLNNVLQYWDSWTKSPAVGIQQPDEDEDDNGHGEALGTEGDPAVNASPLAATRGEQHILCEEPLNMLEGGADSSILIGGSFVHVQEPASQEELEAPSDRGRLSTPDSDAIGSKASPSTSGTESSDEESVRGSRDLSDSQNRLKEEHATVFREKPPPPSKGFPPPRATYRPNVRRKDAVRRYGSLLVWDSHDELTTGHLMWDTGSDHNFMSFTKAHNLGFEPAPFARDDLMRLSGSNGDFTPTHFLDVYIAIPEVDLKEKHRVSFLVVQSNDIEIVLGDCYMGEYEVQEALVKRKCPEKAKAWVVITKDATPDEIVQLRKEREYRKVRALQHEANIRAAVQVANGEHIKPPGSALVGQAGPWSIPAPPTFPVGMGRQYDNGLLTQRQTSKIDSIGDSTVSSASTESSYTSSFAGSSFNQSPTTTMSSKSTTDVELAVSPKRFVQRLKDRSKDIRKGKHAG